MNAKLTNKNVLITGADGFIGSHLVEELLSEGCNVTAFVYYNSFNSWGWLDTISIDKMRNINVVAGDIRDPHCILKAVEKIDVIFHLAALIAIPFSYYSPDSYVDTNVKGTLNVLNAAKKEGCEKVLITSTSEVYGTAKYIPIDENHIFQAQSPYSATKISADRLAESYHRSFGLPVCIVRPFNTYGPRQSARAVIPTIITQLLSGSEIIKLGALNPTRDLLFVKDTVQGFIECAKSCRTIGEEINIATESEISVGDLSQTIIDMINPNAKIVTDQKRIRPENSEVERLYGSNKKINELTEWNFSYSLKRGLKETILWFQEKDNLSRYKSEIYNT